MKKLVLASGNKGKLKEFTQILEGFSVHVVPQSQFNVLDAEETGTTFVENAIIKARHASKITGLPAIADDSGLEVDALNGQPGIYSARYSGEHGNDKANYQKLLLALKDTNKRSARFQCVLAFMRHAEDPTPIIAQASWEGSIGYEAVGEQGHGYDPVFIPENHTMTAAEIDSEAKNCLSHRGKAISKLLEAMTQQGIIKS